MEPELKRAKSHTRVTITLLARLLPALAVYKDVLGEISSRLKEHTQVVLRCVFYPLVSTERKSRWYLEQSCCYAVRHGYIRLFHWTRYNGCILLPAEVEYSACYKTSTDLTDDVINGDSSILLKWMLQHDFLSNDDMYDVLSRAICQNRWNIAFCCISELKVQPSLYLLECLMCENQVGLIETAIITFPKLCFNTAICAEAARYGKLEILQCLRGHGVAWDKMTCANASKECYLDVLAWARRHGCPEH